MQTESVLEFSINGELYCFNTKIVKYVFDLDEFERLDGLDETVIGIVRYDNDAMLLIDTLYLYSQQHCNNLNAQKSVIVIEDENEALYGMVVGEIVKIEDVESAAASLDLSSEELIIRHYKEQEKLVNEIVPIPLLHAKKIPSFRKLQKPDTVTNNETDLETAEFLLFRIADKLFAIDSTNVKEVVEKESAVFELEYKSTRFKGAVAVRDEVYKVANLKPEALQGDELIVVQKNARAFCIEADSVFDIERFEVEKIDSLENTIGYIKGFYNKDGEVVAIVNELFFFVKQEDDVEDVKERVEIARTKNDRKGFLIFKSSGKDFALDMSSVRQVIEVEDMPKSTSSAIASVTESSVAFLSEWNHHGIEVRYLDKLLGLAQMKESQEVVIVEDNGKISGILVESVDDIFYAKESDIAISEDKDSIISGTLFIEEKLVATINPSRVIAQ